MLLSDLTGIRPSGRTYLPDQSLYDPKCLIGVEIEVEYPGISYRTSKYQANPDFWKMDGDGSLRNNGTEYISDPPLFGRDLITALVELEQGLTEAGAQISSRCGLHIHMDVSELTVDELLAFVVGTSLVEPSLFRYVGKERAQNIHCLPFADTGNVLPFLNGIKYGRTPDDVLRSIKSACKYSALNIRPVTYQGSVEFRHHAGSFSASRILEWINILMRIKRESIKYRADRLANLPREEISKLLLGDTIEYTSSDYLTGYLTAKDVLNFNKLEDTFTSVKAMYYNADYVKI